MEEESIYSLAQLLEAFQSSLDGLDEQLCCCNVHLIPQDIAKRQRGADEPWGQRLGSLWTKLIPAQIELQTSVITR